MAQMMNETTHLAFVTYSILPELSPDDLTLAKFLSGKNIKVSAVIWDDENIDWNQFDAVIIRSTWDYFTRTKSFDAWLEKLSLSGCRVMNPLSVIHWNKNKNYFNDFQKQGFAFPPYYYLEQGSNVDLPQLLRNDHWQKAVIKPSISGGAHNTWITTTASVHTDSPRLDAMLEEGDVIVQIYMDEIVTEGELSLVFFNKQFSHAVCKKASSGDFRVQSQFGGTVTPVQPTKSLIQQAEALINSIPEDLLYARVDGLVLNENELCLMELELIEPALFVSDNDQACDNFYQALLELLPLS
jgi:glutathione synthase/RimK-type ligase-like ATP-grasp enzyme